MGRKFKITPSKKAKHAPEAVAKRGAAKVRRAWARSGKKPRVVAGTAAARALGIK